MGSGLLISKWDKDKFADKSNKPKFFVQISSAKFTISRLWSETQIYITLDTRQLISPAFKQRHENIFIVRQIKNTFISFSFK